jgi:chromosome segregation protein
MQLTGLEIYGFKSFAEKTKLAFDAGITGIVGPNGCGKSNIVDSIRWVLGEQKTRNLRSDKMESVIFAGTKAKRKANFAEVSLSFENTKNILPTAYSTVTITRKLFRSGDSEYLINGVTCRLKDIQNLFMDTGVSSDSYAIIELKMVDEMLTNKNNERRRFFEEAAGISKYKIRKKQTLKKLDAADADLERVDDLLFEIEKNLKSLEKQAKRTQKYLELKAQYKEVSAQFALLKLKDINAQRDALKKEEDAIGDQVTKVQSEMAQRESRLMQLKKELIDHEQALSEAQQNLNRHLSRIQSVETDKTVKSERLKYLQQREVAIGDQLETERNKLRQNESDVADLRIRREQLTGELEAAKTEENRLKELLANMRNSREEADQQVAELEAEHREMEAEVQAMRQEIEINSVKVKSLEDELARAEEDKNQRRDDMGAFESRMAELGKEISKLEKEVNTLTVKKEKQAAEIDHTEKTIEALKESVYRKNRLLDAKQNEYNLTKSLVENLEGFPESVKFLKKNAQWIKDAPLVSDVFTTQETYKVALENYLEAYLSHYVVPSREDAMLSVHMLSKSSKGRANFFVLDELDHFKSSNPLLFTQATPAMDVVDFAPEFRKLATYLLGNVYLVSSENDMPDEIPEGTVFLTHSGNVTRRRFRVGGGSLGLFEGKRLGRAKNLEALDKELKKLNKELTAEKLKLDKAVENMRQLKADDFGKVLEPVQKTLLEKQRDLSVLQSRSEEHKAFLARVGKRSESLLEEMEKLRKRAEEITPKLRVRQEELLQLFSKLSEQRALAQERAEALSQQSQAYNEANILLIQKQNQDNLLAQDLSRKREQIAQFDETQAKLKTERDTVAAEIDKLISENLQGDEVIVALYEQKKGLEQTVDSNEQIVGLTKNQIAQGEESLGDMRKKREDLLNHRGTFTEQSTELRVQLSSLKERMNAEFMLDIDTLSEKAVFEKDIEQYTLEAIEPKLHKLRTKVMGFGEINPMAVEAYEEMQERHTFITTQKEDLLAAKQTLLDTIAEIDETAEKQFLETYDEVREHFKRVYRSLFSEDSSADLILKEPDKPLESDIGIMAKPKGKRPQTISQLSGGEKTLTAVALLFSIYLIKPAPFCIFDEVDAPLDDANIDKFNNIIREFSENSQFIIVTHNKRTMAATEVMYGITMQQAGISTAMPVSLKEIYSGE